MLKITLDVDGMACGMCEAHVNEAIRRAFKVKKVESSYRKKRTQIIAEDPIDCEKLKAVIEQEGYTVSGIHTEAYQKREFSLFKKKNM